MFSKSPTPQAISNWKRDARRLAKKNGIPNYQALDSIAKSNGFADWQHLQNVAKSVSDEHDDTLSELPRQAVNAINQGTVQVRHSYLYVEQTEPSAAKKHLIQQLRSIIRRSKNHAIVKVKCDIKSDLAKNLGDDIDAFFDGLLGMFARLDHLEVDVADHAPSLNDFPYIDHDQLNPFRREGNE